MIGVIATVFARKLIDYSKLIHDPVIMFTIIMINDAWFHQ
jgi:hypothetical protein